MIEAVTSLITTDDAGDATVYLGSRLRGRVHAIKYEPGDIYFRGDLAITGETTGVEILVAVDCSASDVWFYPRNLIAKTPDGAAATDAFAAPEVLNERIKVVVTDGGEVATGQITIYLDTPSPY